LPFDSLVAKIISQGINATGLGYVCTGCTTGLRDSGSSFKLVPA
jgi:hypothetical protein